MYIPWIQDVDPIRLSLSFCVRACVCVCDGFWWHLTSTCPVFFLQQRACCLAMRLAGLVTGSRNAPPSFRMQYENAELGSLQARPFCVLRALFIRMEEQDEWRCPLALRV